MLNLRVHDYRKIPNSEAFSLARVDHYVCLSSQDPQATVFVQRGQFFDQSGKPMKDDDVPEWAWEQMAKMSPDAKKAVGFTEAPPKADEEAA